MNTVLIPIDFKKASNNAISYAVAMSRDYPVKHIILAVSDHVTEFEEVFPTIDFIQFSMDEIQETDRLLRSQFTLLKNTVLKQLSPDVKVTFKLGKDSLLTALGELVRNKHADLIILGNDDANSDENSFMAEHLIAIAKASTIPVLVVPSQSNYQPVKQVLIPFNGSNISKINLLKYLGQSKILSLPKLLLLDVGYNTNKTDELSGYGIAESLPPLNSYQHELFSSKKEDILMGINDFILKNNPELIVALPGEHGILYKLTHRDITKTIAQNSLKPVLILKE